MLRQLIRFFSQRGRAGLNHGGRLINPYTLPPATDEEKLLILAGIARSPDDAAYLLAKYHTTSAAQVLKHVARRKRLATFRDRWLVLIQRIDGHDSRDPYGGNRRDPSVIRVEYRYRLPK